MLSLDKFLKNLEEAKEWATKIEENMLASKVEPFSAPRAKVETKPRAMNNFDPIHDSMMALAQKFDQMTTEILQSQANIIDRLNILERERGQPQIRGVNQYYPFSTISNYFDILLITTIDQQWTCI
jgi:hypothetical protein